MHHKGMHPIHTPHHDEACAKRCIPSWWGAKEKGVSTSFSHLPLKSWWSKGPNAVNQSQWSRSRRHLMVQIKASSFRVPSNGSEARCHHRWSRFRRWAMVQIFHPGSHPVVQIQALTNGPDPSSRNPSNGPDEGANEWTRSFIQETIQWSRWRRQPVDQILHLGSDPMVQKWRPHQTQSNWV